MRMDDLTVERVLRTIEAIPPGRVAPYGKVGAIAGVGPRLVGRILSTWGAGVPWWRVPNAAGDMPPFHQAAAREQWSAEGIPIRADGTGCLIAACRADLEQLARDAAAAWADLPGPEDPEPEDPAPEDPAPEPEPEPEQAGYSTGMSSRKK